MGVPLFLLTVFLHCLVKQSHADVVKLVYTPDLGSGALRRGGSSPLIRTTLTPYIRDTLQLQNQLIY